jgi:hypothetical protein
VVQDSLSLLIELQPKWCRLYTCDKGTYFQVLMKKSLKEIQESIKSAANTPRDPESSETASVAPTTVEPDPAQPTS